MAGFQVMPEALQFIGLKTFAKQMSISGGYTVEKNRLGSEVKGTGSHEERVASFHRIRDEIRNPLKAFAAEHAAALAGLLPI
jgi:hypothetical protein